MSSSVLKKCPSKSILLLDPLRVKPFADQPRKRFRGIKQLAESIRLVGQATPIIVTPCREDGFDAELVDGERRLQACRLGKMRIKAVVEHCASSPDRFALSIAANFCRQEHDCIEIAEAIQQLKSHGRTGEEIAGIFGKTATSISQHNSLLKLHPQVQEMLKRAGDEQRESRVRRRGRGRMTLSVALLLVGLNETQQLRAAGHITKKKLSMAAARNYVVNQAKKTGVKVGRQTSPRAKLMALWNAVDTFRHRIEPLVLGSFAALAPVLESANSRERQTLAAQIKQLRDDLGGLAGALQKAGGK
jgi:ParB/RepB/Spo0J family partition protein